MGKNLDQASKEEISKFLSFLGSLDGGKYHEVRFLGSKRETNPSGYFNLSNNGLLVQEITRLDAITGSYITVNGVKSGIEDRSLGKAITKRGDKRVQITDNDIDKINLVFIDVDPERPKNTCSTEEEKSHAKAVLFDVIEYLEQQGWPEPACINDSGNGFHLYYACEFPIGFSHAVKDFLKVLSFNLSTAEAKIDTSVHNPGRIARMPGTWNTKGENTKERPWRMCKNLIYGEDVEKVTAPMIEKISSMLTQINEFHMPKVINKSSATIDEIEEKANIKIVNKSRPALSQGDHVYKFKCPECGNSDISAWIRMTDTGFAYKCFHESCNVSTYAFAKKYDIELDQEKPPKDDDEKALSRVWYGNKYDGQMGLVLPENYHWEDGSLHLMDGKKNKVVTSQPCYIGAITEDNETGEEHVQVCFLRRNRWRYVLIPRDRIMDRSKLVGLSKIGLDVGSDNATDMTNYFRVFESFNEGKMKFGVSSSRMGWHKIGKEYGFLYGNRYISADGVTKDVDLSLTQAKDWPDKCVSYMALTDGEIQLANSMRSKGDAEKWKESIQWAMQHPSVMMMVIASFAAPLLRVFKQNGFALDFCNKTSTGKTTGLYFAASVWGSPDPNASGSLIKSWDSTVTSVERTASARTDLPLLMDDTKTARNREEVANAVFKLSNGQGRGRGTIAGLARDAHFLNIVISTGEDPIADINPHGGLAARILEISGDMFSRQDNQFAIEIDRNKQNVFDNYGFAGPQFVSFLIKNKDKWEDWRKERREIVETMPRRQSNILNRLSNNMSVLWMAGRLLRESGILDVSEEKIKEAVLSIWNRCVDNQDRSDRDKSALMCISYMLSDNASNVVVRGHNETRAELRTLNDEMINGSSLINRNFVARINLGKDGKVESISVPVGQVKKVLESNRYSSTQMKKQWVERGWIDKGKENKQVNIYGKASPRCVTFNKVACELIGIMNADVAQESLRGPTGNHFDTARSNIYGDHMDEEDIFQDGFAGF